LASFCQLVGFDAKRVHDDSGGAAVVAVDCLLQKISHVAGYRLRSPQCRPRATPRQAANLARCHLSGAPLFLDRILSVAMPGQDRAVSFINQRGMYGWRPTNFSRDDF
jgi:hypothetical protein